MARSGFPSMTALLGLLAVAGYQNRDKIAEMMRSQGIGSGGTGPGGTGRSMSGTSGGGGLGGLLDGLTGGQGGGAGGGLGGLLGGLAGGAGLGGLLGGGLGELDGQMRRNGRAEHMDSWVGTGPNRQVEPHDLEAALGPDVLEDLQEATGLSREEILSRLSRELPEAVNQYTPDGRLPDQSSFL